MAPPSDVMTLITIELQRHQHRWSDTTIVFALATYDDTVPMKQFLDRVESELAEISECGERARNRPEAEVDCDAFGSVEQPTTNIASSRCANG